jgi:cellulose synthase/poly-beta-1,6-N-acetylglucosamine synthase-like glycosyltransferase
MNAEMELQNIVFLALYSFAIAVLAFFGLHKFFLLHIYNKFKNNHLPSPPRPKEWPRVTVQLPIYNEKYVLKRLIRSIINFDYPTEKLNIQVLDDSTDSTSRLAQRMVGFLAKEGFSIKYLRRGSRRGFKAGALEYGLKHSSDEFIAIFDADFVPRPDFLKKTIPHLLQPGIGMVQTRWGHTNREYSLLTRLQGILLDAHFLIEHVARHRSGKFFNFNGTAGIWRRQAIEDAGGWQHDTLTEDLDLSYRAQLTGWKFIFLPNVVSPAELPIEINAYKSQQHRWAKGSVQTALKLLPRIWRSDFPFRVRLEATVHLSNNFAYLLMIIPSLFIIPILKFQLEMNWKWPLLLYLFVFFSATFSIIVYYSTAIKDSIGKLWPQIFFVPLLMSLGIGLSLNNGRAALEALFGHKSEFKRTPKFRIEGRRGTWKSKGYKSGKNYLYLFEFLFALYFSYGMVYFLLKGLYLSFPFFLLFQFGFLYISLSSYAVHKI